MKRRRISSTEREDILHRNHDTCHLCGLKIARGQDWDVSHDIPLQAGGADHGDNLKAAHRKCHRVHTSVVDAPHIAKTKRQAVKHIGAAEKAGPKIQSPGFRRTSSKRTKHHTEPPQWTARFGIPVDRLG